MPERTVSVLIPTLNGAEHLRRLLPVLAAQQLPPGWRMELRAVDSSSDDGTRELLERAGAEVRTIARADFGHGRTRNLLAEGAAGELLVFLSQDALPRDVFFLRDLTASFEDARIAGAYARILPRPGEDPLAARTAFDQPEASQEPEVRDLDDVGGMKDLTPEELESFRRFNNVAGAVRAEVLRKLPFPDVDFGEDSAWAADALANGWRIRFAAEAAVYHAHVYSPGEAYRRYKVDAAFHRGEYGTQVRPSLASALKGWVYEMKRDYWFVRRREPEERWMLYARSAFLRAAQVLGQYVGSR